MVIEIKIPEAGESVKEAVLAQWLKKDGDIVQKDEPILVIETDKVTLELVAEATGYLKINVKEGQVVPIGSVVGIIRISEDNQDNASDAKKSLKAIKAPTTEIKINEHPAKDVTSESREYFPHFPTDQVKDSESIKTLMPSVRRLILDKNVDMNLVQGTGPDGKITKGDVLLHIEGLPSIIPEKKSETADHKIARTEEQATRKPMTLIRQRIAERLVEAKQQTAMLTTFNEIDMSRVMDLRARYKETFQKKHGVFLGFMSFFIKACISALKEIPEINAYVDGKDIIYHDYYHIGIAIGSERGLVVPVIRNADRLSFALLEKNIEEFVDKTKTGKLTLSELEGGTFTISNGGVYGSLLSTPILNFPQSGILGMHKIEKRPVVVNDEIVIRSMMYVALSYDHRIVDGRGAVSFLKRIKECMEEPERLLMEI